MRRLVRDAEVGRLATSDPAGRIDLVPFCFALDGDTLWSAVDAKPKTTTKLKRLTNIAAQPEVTVLIDHYEVDWSRLWWVRLRGRARVHDRHPEALARLTAKYEQYRMAPPPGPVIEIAVTSWSGWSAHPLP